MVEIYMKLSNCFEENNSLSRFNEAERSIFLAKQWHLLSRCLRIFDTTFYYPLKKNKEAVRLFINFSAVWNALLEMLNKNSGRFSTMAIAMMMNSSGNWTSWQQDPKSAIHWTTEYGFQCLKKMNRVKGMSRKTTYLMWFWITPNVYNMLLGSYLLYPWHRLVLSGFFLPLKSYSVTFEIMVKYRLFFCRFLLCKIKVLRIPVEN